MGSFQALVDEAFGRAEARAEEIGSYLANTSQMTAGQVERQFSEIRASIGSERERTSQLLQRGL